jgi:hypothetical protein
LIYKVIISFLKFHDKFDLENVSVGCPLIILTYFEVGESLKTPSLDPVNFEIILLIILDLILSLKLSIGLCFPNNLP